MTTTEITRDTAIKVLEVVDAGLVSGVGNPIPGQMCVEAAVCYAMGLPHGDDPTCVSRALRSLKIRLNDSNWSSDMARAKGLRRLAVIQLGSKDVLDDKAFAKRVAELAIRKQVPIALRAAASIHHDSNHKAAMLDAALRCEKEGTREAARHARDVAQSAYASASAYAYASAYASADASASADAYAYASASASADASAYAYASASAERAKIRDKVLSEFAEDVVQILIDMKVPGAVWLELAPLAA